MALEDVVLSRLQKDLEGFNEKYHKELENRVGIVAKGLAVKYRSLGLQIQNKVKVLYDKIGATEDPRKLQALTNKIARLDALAKQLAEDIKNNGDQLQPYYTGLIAYGFQKSYYFTAFGLEQSGRVAAAAPVLTQTAVLGVLVNPWVEDGLTYAQRINVNMSLFAQHIKAAVEDAINLGQGWNETAQEIQKRTGESYFRAVAQARTELNRAAALGNSYAYMQNADILDSKQWDATLDSKTAPKDAINDGKSYELDYDTPDNPGVPGQRIPNHTNCRCRWRPILSAFGVENKRERIARDNTDSESRFGGNVYTEAQTYREYAKARGLPELEDSVAHDKLKRYLRPGETLTDINKTVTRYTAKGKTVVLPKDYWEGVPKTKPGEKASALKKPIPKVQEVQVKSKDQTAAENFDKIVKGLNKKDLLAYGKGLIKKGGLDGVSVAVENMTTTNGYCRSIYMPGKPVDVLEYRLRKNDSRSDAYRVKTALHEFYHAKSNGLMHNFDREGKWAWYEETAAETAAHFMAKRVGISAEIMPAYSDRLISNLPKLKKLEEFKTCKTIADFGEKFMKYRFSEEATADWSGLMARLDAVKPVDKKYYRPYIEYISNNKDDIVQLIYDNYSGDKKAKASYYKQAIKASLDKELNKAQPDLNNNELRSGIVAAFSRLGVK